MVINQAQKSIISKCKYTIEYVSEIITDPEKYQYENNDPFFLSEPNSSKIPPRRNRPPLLVQAAINKFLYRLDDAIPNLNPKQAEQAKVISAELASLRISICSRLQGELDFADKAILKDYKSFDEYKQDLKNILTKIENIFENYN